MGSSRSANTQPHRRSGIATAVKAAHAFATGSAVVAKTLATDLPRAALAHGLEGDGAVMMKIAKVLLLVYAGFLMIWFWATRFRWSRR